MDTMSEIYTLIETAENAVHEQRFELAQALAAIATARAPYILAAPVDTQQRQYQRRIERRRRNWLVVVEHETADEAGEVQP